jgi:L-threonylcarbamoyladenylate synthase
VAFPTETVYGLGAHAMDAAAVARIYATKGRPAHNPVIVHVADVDAARAITAAWPPMAARLAATWWPGPLTLVLPRAAGVPDIVTAGLDKVGVRVPAHPVALALLRAAGLPIAAPSANRSDQVSPTTAEHVRASLGDDADVLLLDGGACEVGIESTVLDVSGAEPVLLRPGGVPREAIERVLGVPVRRAGAADRDDAPRPAPGMLAKHYAPKARIVLVPAGDPASLRVALDEARALHGDAVGVLAITEAPADVPGVAVEAMPADPASYARRLYAALHAMDDRGVALLLVERVPDGDAWDGVRDRLARASA